MLQRGGLHAIACKDLAAACEEARAGLGAMVVAEEAFSGPQISALAAFLELQPAWSDVPLIALARGRTNSGEEIAPSRALQQFNVTILERPLHVQTFLAAVHVALRARRRQYEVRSLLEQRALLLERERKERERAESASRAKDEFLAMLGHELRNPLSPIVTALHLLRMRGEKAQERELTILDRQVAHLSRLVDDLLDVSRIAQGKIEIKREVVHLADIVSRSVEMTSQLFEQRQHHLAIDVPRELCVRGDATRLAQVLANLLTNAAKYTEPKGEIGLLAQRDADDIVIRVRDNGIGILHGLLPRVFDLFVQCRQASDRPAGGLGLGLAIVRNLVLLHGGSVEAHSEGHGRGSEFVVRLPAITSDVPSDTAPRISAPRDLPQQKQPRVLVVDDNEDSAEMLAEILMATGYSARVAHDAPDALRLANEFLPQLAVLDIGLPVIDGYELARRLRRCAPLSRIRLIALTGYGQAEDVRRARDAGFDKHFVKPVDIVQLQAAVGALLTEPSPGREASQNKGQPEVHRGS
jgi:signal transduction histidine kinase/ActR/RegA family two-component response regulator